MGVENSWKTHLIFLSVLVGLLLLYFTYYAVLRDASRSLMYNMQQNMYARANGAEPWQIGFAEVLEKTTNTEIYFLACFMMFPLLSRPRFFYYLLGFVSCDVVKNIIKLGYHMPRPLWMWPEMNCTGSELTLASPSGHTARASFLTTFIVLDLFFASTYARVNNPLTNSRSWQTHKKTVIAIILAGLFYFFGLAYFVFLIGQHTLDQLFLGTQYGLWLACYLHIAWRDIIQDHISFIV